MRHLTHLDVGANLAAGRDVEQLLSERHEMNKLVICYISMREIKSDGWGSPPQTEVVLPLRLTLAWSAALWRVRVSIAVLPPGLAGWPSRTRLPRVAERVVMPRIQARQEC
jgi:hypothetical protein